MPRQAFPLPVADMAAFARSLGRALIERHASQPEPPGHVELMNLLARAAGHRNLQALRARAPVMPPLQGANATTTLTDNARKALGQFDAGGRLKRWPVKFSVKAEIGSKSLSNFAIDEIN